jgi:hypothetical protein
MLGVASALTDRRKHWMKPRKEGIGRPISHGGQGSSWTPRRAVICAGRISVHVKPRSEYTSETQAQEIFCEIRILTESQLSETINTQAWFGGSAPYGRPRSDVYAQRRWPR